MVVGLVRLLLLVGEILLLVLIAAIMATGLHPLIDAVQRRRWTRRHWQLSRGLSIVVVYLGLIITLGLVSSLLIVPIVAESREFVENAPELYQGLRTSLVEFQARYSWLPDLTAIIDRLPQEAGRLTEYVGAATGVAFRVFGGIVSAVTVFILSVYMLLEAPAVKAAFLDLFPAKSHKRLEALLRDVGLKFGGWLRGQLLLGLIIGVISGLGTWMLGLPYPFLLGLAAGITEMVPIIGPVLGAIPAILVALFGPFWRLLAVIAFFTAVQQLEGHLLVPRVMQQAVGLSPLLTIIAILIGAKLMGIVGALLAVPIAAALQVIVGEVIRTFRESE
ncbi:MAG: AI-2E family transporter [Armatimonadota bacterium]